MNVNIISETNEILDGKDSVSKTDHPFLSKAKNTCRTLLRWASENPNFQGFRENPRFLAQSLINI
jgi:hypothetical protein